MLNLANFIGVSVYLWSVDEKHHFLQTNLQKTPSEKKYSQLFACKSKCRLFVESNHSLSHSFSDIVSILE